MRIEGSFREKTFGIPRAFCVMPLMIATLLLSSCGGSRTPLSSFLGRETAETMSFDQLMEGRTLISQDVSPLVDMEATFTTEDWDYPGFTVMANSWKTPKFLRSRLSILLVLPMIFWRM